MKSPALADALTFQPEKKERCDFMKQAKVSSPIDTVSNLINSYREAYEEAGMLGIAVFLHENIDLFNRLNLGACPCTYDMLLAEQLECLISAYNGCSWVVTKQGIDELPFPEVVNE